MEIGSSLSSLTESRGPNSSSDSLTRFQLKLGKKVYSEGMSVGPSTPKSGGALPKKVRGAAVQGSQPPRCQVEGCLVDLSDAKAYYSRHKVCGTHSKFPRVIVGGVEQRFCQQCSRFHLLPEFDQDKRSCRRRLAGHNERRRKIPSRSLFSSHFGRLPSSLYEENSNVGGFLLDFTSCPRLNGRDAWPSPRSVDQLSEIQTTATRKFFLHPWESGPETQSSNLIVQGSASGTSYTGPGISQLESFTRVVHSLLSDMPWDSQNGASAKGMSNLMKPEGVTIAQPRAHGASTIQYPSLWGFRSSEAVNSSHGMPPDLVLGQISQPLGSHYAGDLELFQQSSRQLMELDHSRANDESSTQQMHWSL